MGIPRFEVVHGLTNQIQYKLYDGDDKVVISSEGFPNKDNCFKAIRGIKENARNDQRWEKKSVDGKHSFTLKAPGHEILAKGGPYATVEERDYVSTVVRNSVEAAVMDKA